MATVTGGRVVAVEAKRDRLDVPKGMNMNVNVEDVGVNKDEITVQYVFTVTYNENVGSIKVKGLMHAKEDVKKAKDIAREWKENRKLPDDFAEVLMNYVNYVGGVAGTFFSQPLGLNAPLMLIPIRIKPAEGMGPLPMQGPTKAEKEKAA